MNKGTAIVGFFLCFLSGMGLMYGVDRSRGTSIEAESASAGSLDQSASPIPVTSKDPMWGKADAPVTIVEISDFQCPFCSRVNPTLKQIRETYGPDKVRVVWKNNPLPFHPRARPAAEAAMTVFALGGNDAFWKFNELAFANQQQLTDENFETWAKQAGVDVSKFREANKSKKYASKVDEDLAFGQKIGANGTPNFRVNGVEISGAQPFDKFKEVIDQQLAEAKKMIASGTSAANVYVELTKRNAKVSPEQPSQQQPQKPQQPPEEDKTIWKVPITKDDPIRGEKDALVTIVEFSDFQCPFCKRTEDTLKQIMQSYGKDVRIVWKDNPLPFHPRAKPSAVLARLVLAQKGDKGFWEAHDALFDSQPKLEDDDLKGIAEKFGLSWDGVKTAIDKNKFDDLFDAIGDLAMDLNARGTPHFFVNGYRVTGAQPFEKFKEVIDAQLAKAKAVADKGVPRGKVYEEIMKEGKEPPPPEKKEVPAATAKNPARGGQGAKIVIQEWSDFQCPFCKRVEPTLDELAKEYGGKIKVVWHNMPLPFHQDAPLAAEAAAEAFAQKGNDGFWKFHDKLYEDQGNADGLKRENLEKIAQAIGLDMTKFKAALDGHTHKADIDADAQIGQKAGLNGTPSFVINGYYLSGAQPPQAFKKVISRAMKEAGMNPAVAAKPAAGAAAPGGAPKEVQ